MNTHIIDALHAADSWENGYALGNGRIGAVTTGDAWRDRFALNHDILWRRYIQPGCAERSELLGEFRRLWFGGQKACAVRRLMEKVPQPGGMIYINPLVPAGDLCLCLRHRDNETAENYRRELNMQTGIARVDFSIQGHRYLRESFCSSVSGVLVTRMTTETAVTFSVEAGLSRFPDHDCHLEGFASFNEAVLRGELEEGVRFCVVTRLYNEGGRTTCGRRHYISEEDSLPPTLNGFLGTGWRNTEEETFTGPSCCADTVRALTVLTAICTSDETDGDLTEACRRKLDDAPRSYERLREEHVAGHRRLFDRVCLDLNSEWNGTCDCLLAKKEKTDGELRKLIELQFDMARYLAISGAMPEKNGEFPRSPLGLMGIWNQEGRPLWDGDYHMDLNLEMTYWGMDRLNLSEAMPPLLGWMLRMMPQGRKIARNQFGCEGICFGAVADPFTLGDTDYIGYSFLGAASWLLQILWQHYEYTLDREFLRSMYPVLYEAAEFFASYLARNPQGELTVVPDTSPEMSVWLDDLVSQTTESSSFNLELIHELFRNLLKADAILEIQDPKAGRWRELDAELPWPKTDENGILMEWQQPLREAEEGHRHRSHLVGLCPGNRINRADTPELVNAARKALKYRQRFMSDIYYPSFSPVWDAQLSNRMGDAEDAWQQIKMLVSDFPCEGLLLSHRKVDAPSDGGWFMGHRLFQIEANLGAGAAISEFFVQDGGIIELLPSLPGEIPEGRLSGLRVRGGFEITMAWKDGQVTSARIKSTLGGTCKYRIGNTVRALETTPGEVYELLKPYRSRPASGERCQAPVNPGTR